MTPPPPPTSQYPVSVEVKYWINEVGKEPACRKVFDASNVEPTRIGLLKPVKVSRTVFVNVFRWSLFTTLVDGLLINAHSLQCSMVRSPKQETFLIAECMIRGNSRHHDVAEV